MQEVWKPVVGYEGLYEVSNKGRVKSLVRAIYDINTKTVINYKREKYLTGRANGRGYPIVRLVKNGVEKNMYIHRLVGIAFIPNPKNLPVINHLDSDPTNNCVENLEWCTQKHNMEYAVDQMRVRAKLTPDEVLDIRTRHKNGEPNQSIYESYPQVIPKTVRNVINERTWKRVCKIQ